MRIIILTFFLSFFFFFSVNCMAFGMGEDVVHSTPDGGRVFNSSGGVYTQEGGYEAFEIGRHVSFCRDRIKVAPNPKFVGREKEEIVNSTESVSDFNSSGAIYTKKVGYEAPETNKLITCYLNTLADARMYNIPNAEINALNDLGIAYHSIGQYGVAVKYYEQALSKSSPEADNSSILNNIALTYASLSRFDKAVEYYKLALRSSKKKSIPDSRGQGVIYNNLAGVYRSQGRYKKAIATYKKAFELLDLGPEKENRRGQEIVLTGLGGVYQSLNQSLSAQTYYKRALEIARDFKNLPAEAKILNNIGVTYNSLGKQEEAIIYYQQALAIKRELIDKAGEATTLNNLMFSWKKIGNSPLAIFYGKEAVNAYQGLRNSLQNIDKETQDVFLSSIKDTYRTLSDLLIAVGRLPEAQQVLKLLKVEEYVNFVQRNYTETSLTGQADLTATEAIWRNRYQEIGDQLTAIGVEHANLLAKTQRTDAEENRLRQLDNDLIVANKEFQSFLDSLESESLRSSISKDKINEFRESQALMADLGELGNGAVVLYTLVGEKSYRVILVTPSIQKSAEYPITASELNDKILKFRESLENPSKNPKPLAQALYTILLGPIAKDLEGAGAKTLMWSLDGALRYLPMNALYDGKQYLIERYRNVLFTLASEPRLKDKPQSPWKGLGLGVSKSHQPDFNALPGVDAELHEIIYEGADTTIGGVVPGTIKMDENFTADSMKTALQMKYPLVHIASHFSFKPGNEIDSFLLLGDGSHLTLYDIRTQTNIFKGVDLLTLSACDTAMGGTGSDGNEVEGFSVLAQRQGAKAVLATLWPVADESTCLLMHDFYNLRQKNNGILKLEALRMAQISMLGGTAIKSATQNSTEIKCGANQARGKLIKGVRDDPDKRASYAHPYYWAPFILIGNWQ